MPRRNSRTRASDQSGYGHPSVMDRIEDTPVTKRREGANRPRSIVDVPLPSVDNATKRYCRKCNYRTSHRHYQVNDNWVANCQVCGNNYGVAALVISRY